MMLGIIRVLTTNDKHVLYEHGNQMKESFHIETDTFCIPDQWSGIYDEESECISLPKIVTLAKEMEESNQFTAITISCAADPALQQVREEVSLPVIGAGSAGAYAASMVGDKVGIIGITEEAPVNMTELLKEKFYSYGHEPSIRKTVHLFSEDSQAKLLKLAERQIEQGA